MGHVRNAQPSLCSGLAFSRPLLCPEEEAEQQDEFPSTGGTVDSFAGPCTQTKEPWAPDCVPGVLMAAVGLTPHLQAVYFFHIAFVALVLASQQWLHWAASI